MRKEMVIIKNLHLLNLELWLNLILYRLNHLIDHPHNNYQGLVQFNIFRQLVDGHTTPRSESCMSLDSRSDVDWKGGHGIRLVVVCYSIC